eukprot:m.55873 g.55873  ORF g.55873 m.55873 type:complete len:51 (+) comp6722_c0_seq1:1660-1812(+)
MMPPPQLPEAQEVKDARADPALEVAAMLRRSRALEVAALYAPNTQVVAYI